MPLPKQKETRASAELKDMIEKAREASEMLKALSHESRLLLLCALAEGEKSVTELLEQFLGATAVDRLPATGALEARPPGSHPTRRQGDLLPSAR